MTSNKVSLRIKQGDTARLTFTASSVANGVTAPLDLTGCVAKFAIAERPGRAPNWSWDSVGPEERVSIADPAAGKVTVTLQPADSRAWERLTQLVWELTVTFPTGDRLTLADGSCVVDLEVTGSD